MIELPQPDEPDEPAIVATYRRELTEAGRLDTPAGASVMHLAALFSAGNHTAAGAASLHRELDRAMDKALRGAKSKADAMDELAERRRFKASTA